MASPDRFDGLEVDRHQARFSGTVELDPTDADRMSVDAEFMAVLVCTVGGASVDGNSKGELIRTNKFKLSHFAVVRDPALQGELYEKLAALTGLPGDEDPGMFTPNVDGNGEVISDVAAEPEDEGSYSSYEEGDNDDDVWTPPAPRQGPSEVRPGPTAGSQPRQYDKVLAGFVNER